MKSIRALWQSTVGKKAAMALSGTVLFLWLVAHMAGNLMIFAGPATFDAYGAALHARPWLLWPMRVGLLMAAAVHVAAAWQLSRRAWQAGGPGRGRRYQAATWAARSMRWGGALLLAFILFHLAHLTWGAVPIPAGFQAGAVYHNVVSGLGVPLVAIFYLVALVALALHLVHGLGSVGYSLGLVPVSRRRHGGAVSTLLAVALAVGFGVIPLAVLFGVVR